MLLLAFNPLLAGDVDKVRALLPEKQILPSHLESPLLLAGPVHKGLEARIAKRG
jgi:hypothetical protein